MYSGKNITIGIMVLLAVTALGEANPSAVSAALPELVNERAMIMNCSGMEPGLLFVWDKNRDLIGTLLDQDSPSTRAELRKRMVDNRCPDACRLLYAGMLASLGDEAGQKFLIERGNAAVELEEAKDVFWMIGHIDWLRPRDDGKERPMPDMHWAENFMLTGQNYGLDRVEWLKWYRKRYDADGEALTGR